MECSAQACETWEELVERRMAVDMLKGGGGRGEGRRRAWAWRGWWGCIYFITSEVAEGMLVLF
jgi:hypothetical protein